MMGNIRALAAGPQPTGRLLRQCHSRAGTAGLINDTKCTHLLLPAPAGCRPTPAAFRALPAQRLHVALAPEVVGDNNSDTRHRRFAWALAFGVAALDQVPVLGHRCDNPLGQRIGPGQVEASSAWRNRQEWVMRRNTIGGSYL